MPEFDLIGRIRDIISVPSGPECVLGIGDDAAVLEVPADRQLVVCTDTVVSGVHFPAGTAPDAVGYKSLAVNLSDLAAMGATPAWFLLALTLPEDDPDWVDAFAHGLYRLASAAGIALVGGDTTSGPLSVTITAAAWWKREAPCSVPARSPVIAWSCPVCRAGRHLPCDS